VFVSSLLRSVFVGTLGLTLAAAAALALTIRRTPRDATTRRAGIASLVRVCWILQTLHFLEEYFTRFYERFPSLFGLTPWPTSFFVPFNLLWLGIWANAAMRIDSPSRTVWFPLWFLAITMMLNGVSHPVLAVAAKGYFPGLVTAPAVGVAGFALWYRMMGLSRRVGISSALSANKSETAP
jgi:hypothetical protein